MKQQEQCVWQGGMLAVGLLLLFAGYVAYGIPIQDEMGMGKTIQIIALLISDRKKPNLVIAYVLYRVAVIGILIGSLDSPTVAIMQWKNEIEAHTDGMKVLIWHGHARESDVKELKKYDVVSYQHMLVTVRALNGCIGFKYLRGPGKVYLLNFSIII